MKNQVSVEQQVEMLLSAYEKNPDLKGKIAGLTSINKLRGYLNSKKKLQKTQQYYEFRLEKNGSQQEKLTATILPQITRDLKILHSYIPEDDPLLTLLD